MKTKTLPCAIIALCYFLSSAIADDSAALQMIFNQAKENSSITIPPGDYYLDGTKPIRLKSNLVVNAYGARFHLPPTLEDRARGVLMQGENITIQDCTFERNGKFMWDYGYLWQIMVWPDQGLLSAAEQKRADAVRTVTDVPGLVAFWDFVQRERAGKGRFVAHVPPGQSNNYPLDAANYIKDYWGKGREATYSDFPELGRGPFGNAIRIVKEPDPDFRPFLFVARRELHDTPLDIKGANKSVSVVVWAIRESGNHALAGIWHEGTDLKQSETASIAKVERGQRQYALFAGLNKQGSACGHVSENGASSFLNKYALHKCNSLGQSPEVPADAPAELLDQSWQCFAMSFDHEKDELTGWLNGVSGDRWLDNPKNDTLISSAYKAYMQGYYARTPEKETAEDKTFPKDQYYNPPEGKPLSVKVLSNSGKQRVELHEHRYTKVEVTYQDGKEVSRELVALRLNPWWYPHDLYIPKDANSGGPFTIGRVIHSSRSVGFTGWIGGVAVFDCALTEAELQALARIRDVR